MKTVFALLLFISIASFAGAVALISYRQKTIRALAGYNTIEMRKKIREVFVYLRTYIIKINQNLVKNNRYENIVKLLKKINQEDKITPEYFLFLEQLTVIVLGLLTFVICGDWLISMGVAIFAFFLPKLVLREKIRNKQNTILIEMPDAFDIIGANIEGGLSVNQAMSRYCSRIKGVFSAELMIVIRKTQLGKSFSAALSELNEKMSVRELSGFVNAFIQADKSGGNIREIIKNQAIEIRQKRFQYLKKKAHEAPVKLLLPLMLFIFPVIFIVLFVPIVIKLMQGF